MHEAPAKLDTKICGAKCALQLHSAKLESPHTNMLSQGVSV